MTLGLFPSRRWAETDWDALIGPVADALLGEPTSRRGGEHRYRARGSLVVHVSGPRAGTWHDYEAGVGGGVLALVERERGGDRRAALAWLRERGHLAALAAETTDRPARRGAPRGRAAHKAGLSTQDTARRLWQASEPIPADAEHPARRWLANRRLWWPELPTPPAVRWLDAGRGGWRAHRGAGAVVAILARPEAWTEAWPELPALAALACVHVDGDGSPAPDRPESSGGVPKRTYGRAQGALTLLGAADPALARGLNIAEGLADALALASREPPTAAATLTTPHGLPDLAAWLVRWDTIRLYADDDTPGRRAAQDARLRLRHRGVNIEAVTVAGPGKDPAAAGAPLPLPERAAARACAARMTAEGLPGWEARRLAWTLTPPAATPPQEGSRQ